MAWNRGLFARLLTVMAGLALSGCVALGGVDRISGNMDKSSGAARNNSILLNIIRASRKEPLYFYAISNVSASGLEDFKFSLPPITFGPHQTSAQRTFTFGTGGLNVLDSQASGSFQIGLLGSHDFYAGMLAPLDLREVNILLRQNFPRELVYRLAVQSVTVYDGVQIRRFINDPRSKTYPQFQFFFREAMLDGITTETFETATPSPQALASPGGAAKTKASPEGVAEAARLCWDPALADLSDVKRKADLEASGNECGVRAPGTLLEFTPAPPGLKQTYEDCKKESSGGASGNDRVCVRVGGANIAIQLSTRSLFAIFQYLGDLVANNEAVALNNLGADVEPRTEGLLVNIETQGPGRCFASVRSGEQTFCIPQEGSDNIKRTFDIINALQALKTSQGDLPITQTVRIEQ